MLNEKAENLNSISPLSLAFVGDTVFDLLVRTELARGANMPVKELHNSASKRVCASAQAETVKRVLPLLTDEEAEIFRRGRNASPSGHPKNQSVGDYHYATGLECLFGWLYLGGRIERIEELYSEGKCESTEK